MDEKRNREMEQILKELNDIEQQKEDKQKRDREHRTQYQKDYYQRNRERKREWCREYYQRNRERILRKKAEREYNIN